MGERVPPWHVQRVCQRPVEWPTHFVLETRWSQCGMRNVRSGVAYPNSLAIKKSSTDWRLSLDIARRLEAIAIRVDAIASRVVGWRPQLPGLEATASSPMFAYVRYSRVEAIKHNCRAWRDTCSSMLASELPFCSWGARCSQRRAAGQPSHHEAYYDVNQLLGVNGVPWKSTGQWIGHTIEIYWNTVGYTVYSITQIYR